MLRVPPGQRPDTWLHLPGLTFSPAKWPGCPRLLTVLGKVRPSAEDARGRPAVQEPGRVTVLQEVRVSLCVTGDALRQVSLGSGPLCDQGLVPHVTCLPEPRFLCLKMGWRCPCPSCRGVG